MSIRYKLGPVISGTFSAPAPAPGTKPDASCTVAIRGIDPAGPGLINLGVAFTIIPYDPAATNPLAEVHAFSFAAGHALPIDAATLKASGVPSAMSSTAGVLGGDVIVTIPNAVDGQQTIMTLLGIDDPTFAG